MPSRMITDQLNAEWQTIAARPVPRRWRAPALVCCSSLADALDAITASRRSDAATADTLLIELLTHRVERGDDSAGRLVLQAMLGRAVNLARRAYRAGATGIRGDLPQLMATAVAALWNTIATYPVHRRRHKVSVNLCMDALGQFTALLDDHVPEAVDVTVLETVEPIFAQHTPAPAIELLNTLAWGIDTNAISRDDAALLTRVYCPGPGQPGGAQAVARELELAPATVRQRCRRATHRLAVAVHSHQAEQPLAA